MGSVLRIKDENPVVRSREASGKPDFRLITSDDRRARVKSVLRGKNAALRLATSDTRPKARTYKLAELRTAGVGKTEPARARGGSAEPYLPQNGNPSPPRPHLGGVDVGGSVRQGSSTQWPRARRGPTAKGVAPKTAHKTYGTAKRAGSGLLKVADPELSRNAKEDPGTRAINLTKDAAAMAGRTIYGTGKRTYTAIRKVSKVSKTTLRGSAKVAKTSTKAASKTAKTSAKVAAKATKAAAQATVRAAKVATKVAIKLAQLAAKVAAAIGKAVAKVVAAIASNPYLLLAIVIIALLVLLVILIIDLLTPAADPSELMGEDNYTEIVSYLQEKDAAILAEWAAVVGQEGDTVSRVLEITPSTDPKLMAIYLWVLFSGEDFTKVTLDQLRQEMALVYGRLYRIETRVDTTTIVTRDDAGSDVEIETTILYVTLTGVPLEAFLSQFTPTVFNEKQLEYYTQLLEQYIQGEGVALPPGVFTGGPFEDWRSHITGHFGIRGIHPVTGEENVAHKGVDIGFPAGTGIFAVTSGTVQTYPFSGSYGNYFDIINGNVTVRHAHCSAIYVTTGQQVKAGDVVAAVGSTGRSTGPHLHLEIIIDGVHVDPEQYLP